MELTEKFKNLEENILLLREIKDSVSIDDLHSNKRYEWEIRYGLLESIQIIIDISCKITSHYNLGNPKNYRECVELLLKHKFLQITTAKKVIAMIGLRNLLVHEYVSIDNEKLFHFLDSLDDFINFIDELKMELN
ncbi:MAG: HepT-like ribonuclease domain-containing protein [Campylobacterota bacterium]|nr:HepT-like ribonuclease domain-containing protein [Campylobacterota bacterium]